MRFEVCIGKNLLKYKKGEPRSLKNYFKKEKYTEYMNSYIGYNFKIFYSIPPPLCKNVIKRYNMLKWI